VEIMAAPGRAAFFDLERTLTPQAVEQVLGVELWRRGEVPHHRLLAMFWAYARYNLGLLHDYEAMKRYSASGFAGRDHARDLASTQELFERLLWPAVSLAALRTVERLKAEGVALYVVSSTYHFMVEPYAKRIGADGFFGVPLEVQGGRTTGRISGAIPHQEGKARIAREIAAARGFELSDCQAYGDSLNDLPMLEAVGAPHAVNPARGLRRIAERRGWPILQWR
jgi:HAD superfamily hydrolase (TIGR01490 family)